MGSTPSPALPPARFRWRCPSFGGSRKRLAEQVTTTAPGAHDIRQRSQAACLEVPEIAATWLHELDCATNRAASPTR